jgi:hypothetical protein
MKLDSKALAIAAGVAAAVVFALGAWLYNRATGGTA